MTARRGNRSEARSELTAFDVAELLLNSPRFRALVPGRLQYHPGEAMDVDKLRADASQHGYYLTQDDARVAGVPGCNLRCNVCGTYGATWMPGERPGWRYGNLAACPTDKVAFEAEYRRRATALAELREVRFEQPPGRNKRKAVAQ